VVLLDLTLPDSSGMETISHIQQAAPQLPTVVMTGASDPRFAGRALALGAQDYLVKGDASGPMVARAIRYAISRMHTQIERQSLIVRLKQEQAAMREEMDAARRMQLDLLPTEKVVGARLAELDLTVDSYFQPSSGIGGDLWGCLELSGSRMGFYAFDFSGHGVSAALNVFRLHTLIRERAGFVEEPAEMLSSLNQVLANLLTRGQYATMWLGMVDVATDELVWSAAGHPPPVLVRGDGTFEMLDTQGVPLGAALSATYHNRRVSFPRGASLFTYSDALIEAQRPDGEMLEEADLIALLEASRGPAGAIDLPSLLNRFFQSVQLPLTDDLTIVSIRRGGP
jgi:phosphoserine phosphatase RsbU/P